MALKLRPVLDHRMPTLANKAAFMLPETSSVPRKANGLRRLEAAPPRGLKEVRQLLGQEIKNINRRLTRLERAYYGEHRTVHQEVERTSFAVHSVMVSLPISGSRDVHRYKHCNSATRVDEMLRKTHPSEYKGSQENVQILRDVFVRVKAYLPDKVGEVTTSCSKLLEMLDKYCVSFYHDDADKDGYLETAAHFQEQIQTWKRNIETSLTKSREVTRRFKGQGVSSDHLTPPVSKFVDKHKLGSMLVFVLFADACTNIRNALSLMTAWLKTDETYSGFLKHDLIDLETLKEEKIKVLREARTKYHSLTFRLNQLEQDCVKAETEVIGLRDRKDNLTREEKYISEQVTKTEFGIDFNENKYNRYRAGDEEIVSTMTQEYFKKMTEDLKAMKENLPIQRRQLATVRYKLNWVEEKDHAVEKFREEMTSVRSEVKEAGEERGKKEKEFLDVEKSLKLARKILLCKTSNEAVEKIYYSLPVSSKNARQPGSPTKSAAPVDKACRVISRSIERDWVHLYRNLPFFPKRGAETIEKDISELSTTGARGTLIVVCRRALDRWRRHHTRAMVEDLKSALRKIKRLDIVKSIEDELNPPVKEEEEGFVEEKIPPVPPELIPYYELGERYDQLRALNRM